MPTNYLTNDTELTTVADAIRQKGGTSAPLSFPSGFAQAISDISTGITPTGTIQITQNGQVDVTQYATADVNVSGVVDAPMKDVNFYDYDGTRLYSYTAQEFLALSAMPANPTHDGLTAQGWNWSLANAKAQVSEIGAADIGQIYATDDGSTRIHIHLEDATPMKPFCGFVLDGTATIDWGDGSQIDTVTGTSTTVANAIFTQHEYNSCGDYIITIKVLSGQLGLLGNSLTSNVARGALIFTGRATYNNYTSNLLYLSAVKKIEIGSNVVIGEYAFLGCTNLSALSIPNTVNSLGGHAFTSSGIKCVIYPPSVTQLGGYGLEGSTVQTVSFSDSLTSLSFNGVNNNPCFVRFILPNSLTNLGISTFQNTYTIRNLIIPSSVNTIGIGAVSNTSISYVKFCGEIPPSAGSSSSLSPAYALLFKHNAASTYLVPPTNYPSPANRAYIGFATYEHGATLPTLDTTEAYNVVWYTTKSDALAQTNPITVGNGNEIYCRYTLAPTDYTVNISMTNPVNSQYFSGCTIYEDNQGSMGQQLGTISSASGSTSVSVPISTQGIIVEFTSSGAQMSMVFSQSNATTTGGVAFVTNVPNPTGGFYEFSVTGDGTIVLDGIQWG